MDCISNQNKNLEPKNKPYKLRLDTIKKGQDGKYWKVIKHKTSKRWIRATRRETMCKNYLTATIKKNLKKYKEGGYKSSKQAIAASYTMTKRKFPTCKLVSNKLKTKKVNKKLNSNSN